jgi:lipopolysaccharide transport system ATP-binding protein
MAHIKVSSATVEYPIFNATGRSLTSKILETATGGKLDSDPNGKVLVRALSDVSFELSDGDRLGVVGHNGAGKSTLLRMVAEIYAPSSGTVSVEGDIGSLIDINLGINPEATGNENIFIRGRLLGLTKQQVAAKYDEIVSFAELGGFMNMPVRTYSSGMQLRLAFAISTIVKPDILIMDEWLSIGDEDFRAKAENRLSDLVLSTKILVVATHSKLLLESVCNKALWLEHGSVKMLGPADQVGGAYFG